MYTIFMNDDKQLIQSKRTKIYQKETNVDKIQFLFPQIYDGLDLSKYLIILKYRDLGNEPHAEFLSYETELYKEKLQSIYKLTSDFTRFAGDINIHITFVLYNNETEEYEEVLHTGETTINISPVDIFTDGYTNEELDLFSQLILSNKTNIESNTSKIKTLEENQIDDIVIDEDVLKVSSNGEEKGEGVAVSEILDLSTLSNSEIDEIFEAGGL